MYNAHFGLKACPFNLTADPGFLYLSEDHREALVGLVYVIYSRKGFVVLASEAGMGKTTLLGAALKQLQGLVCSSLILNPVLTPGEFLETALLDFGVTNIPASKALRLNLLHQMLLRTQHEGKTAVLLVDEAHKLSPEVLEEIRLLTNFEMADQKLLQIVLSGQQELDAILDRPELWQLKQRVTFRMSIKALTRSDVEQYVQHRWKKAGGALPAAFEKDAIDPITIASRGIPRVINVICDNALTLAMAEGARLVSATHIRKACSELHLTAESPPPSPDLNPVAAIAPVPAYSGQLLRTLDRYDTTSKRPSVWTRWFRKPMVDIASTGIL